MNYVELRGITGHRIAFGKGGSFMILELTEKYPGTVPQGKEQVKVTNGCMVWVYGFPAVYVQDFYPKVVEEVSSIGNTASTLSDTLKGIYDKPIQVSEAK